MSRKGKVYTPTETVSAEKAYIEAAGEYHPVYEGAVRLELTFQEDSTSVLIIPVDDWHTKLRGDIDNYVKLALDGIQRAGIIANDRQVVHVDAMKI
jgi:Holliday junction resolvase RusA-like endonuclease